MKKGEVSDKQLMHISVIYIQGRVARTRRYAAAVALWWHLERFNIVTILYIDVDQDQVLYMRADCPTASIRTENTRTCTSMYSCNRSLLRDRVSTSIPSIYARPRPVHPVCYL